MKKFISVMLVLVLAATMMVACNKEKEKPVEDPKPTEVAQDPTEAEKTPEPEEPDETPEVETWTVGGELTDELIGTFTKATETLLGVEYTPTVYLGSRETKSQMDYFYFCLANLVVPESVPYPTVVMVTEKSGEEQTAVEIFNIDLSQTITANYVMSDAQDAQLMNSWKLDEDPIATDEDKAIVEKALNGYNTSIYDVIVHLADNDEGKLSCYLCRAYIESQEEQTNRFVLMFVEDGDALTVKKVSVVNYDKMLSGMNH